ncbi:hypothetical protein FPZ12_037255 [Amycolatopsis acidicola]|uniref:Uncharacterized protein n=1 Tax=Amycolatopsis acidicola TaxID=2596893 RepID=A0A5N0URX7_9PSEU|nr:type VII secretion target [Amycolatopsis acidicola]KAA9152224.1 hypothetical protein FPZ12_037255 [Amycolatopsis acidicola]
MSGGFGAVPEELRQAGNAITDVVGQAAGLEWRGPGGDYGHAGVQQGWARFVEDLRGQVEKLQAAADAHAENLKQAAVSYVAADDEGGSSLSGIGAAIGETGMVGGGWAGPLRDRAGEQSGIMSPRRSRELFPQQDIGDTLNPDDGRDY